MANEILQKTGTGFSLADHAGDFSPTAANDLQQGTPTEVQLTLASLADGSYRQSAKFDLGATRAATYSVFGAFEFAATPTVGDVVIVWWLPSTDSVAANANVAGASGSDAAYSGYATATAAESLAHATIIGSFPATDDVTTVVQIGWIGVFAPMSRYGSIVVQNETAAAFHTDDVESHIWIEPVIDEVQ